MARGQGIKVENDFTKGLLTENHALNFPENACTDTLNCVFRTGKVYRRGAIDLEEGYSNLVNITETQPSSDIWTEFMWTQVAGLGSVNILVQQQGSRLHFFDVSSSTTVSPGKLASTILLTSYTAKDTPYLPDNYICQYTQGNGYLIVVNRACDPIYITYDQDTSTVSATKITLQYRDFLGLDSYPLNTRPVFADINALKTNTTGAKHFYNLLNQGWWQGGISGGNPDANSALGQWDTARADMPSNADTVLQYRASPTDPFDPARVGAYDQGNTPASKGHFILNVGDSDRQQALVNAGYTLSFSGTSAVFISRTLGSIIGDFDHNLGNVFDGNKAQTITNTTTATAAYSFSGASLSRYVGKDLLAGKAIYKVQLYPYTAPFLSTSTFGHSAHGAPGVVAARSVTCTLYGKNSVPANDSDGTILGTTTAPPGSSSVIITSTDQVTTYRYVWVKMEIPTTTGETFYNIGLSELDIYEAVVSSGSGSLTNTDVTYERPQVCAFFSSRAWYSGIDAATLSNNIYFSQIIEKASQFGYCYQVNDPTSEISPDILPSDGGIIRIPEMGKVVKLYPYQTSLLVFATNGVWIIQADNGFTATDFKIRKISSLGTSSMMSFIDIKGIPTWFGEEAILQINYNPQFDSFSVDSISDSTIRTFFYGIPVTSRVNVKGAFDVKENMAYWMYASGRTGIDSPTQYDSILTLNVLTGAFSPFSISPSDTTVHGIVYVFDSTGISDPKIKMPFTAELNATTMEFNYADFQQNSYVDWERYSVFQQNPALKSSYESYFVTGYKVHGEALKFVQPNYIMVYLEQGENQGCFIQGVFDFATSESVGKWGTKQQIYNDSLENRSYNYRRLKIRGKGRSIQFKFSSDGDKGFNIIGWGGLETANQEV